jgi:hypothetical protein
MAKCGDLEFQQWLRSRQLGPPVLQEITSCWRTLNVGSLNDSSRFRKDKPHASTRYPSLVVSARCFPHCRGPHPSPLIPVKL